METYPIINEHKPHFTFKVGELIRFEFLENVLGVEVVDSYLVVADEDFASCKPGGSFRFASGLWLMSCLAASLQCSTRRL